MVNALSVQTRITNKIFNPQIASTVVRQAYASQVLDKWGDATVTRSGDESILAVPYSMLDKQRDYQPFGDLVKGDVIMAFKHDQDLDYKDVILFNSKTYMITGIEKFPLGDLYLVKIAKLSEQL